MLLSPLPLIIKASFSVAIDKTASNFDKPDTKVKKLKRLIDIGEYDANVARSIPGTLKFAYQGMLDDIKTIEPVAL